MGLEGDAFVVTSTVGVFETAKVPGALLLVTECDVPSVWYTVDFVEVVTVDISDVERSVWLILERDSFSVTLLVTLCLFVADEVPDVLVWAVPLNIRYKDLSDERFLL